MQPRTPRPPEARAANHLDDHKEKCIDGTGKKPHSSLSRPAQQKRLERFAGEENQKGETRLVRIQDANIAARGQSLQVELRLGKNVHLRGCGTPGAVAA